MTVCVNKPIWRSYLDKIDEEYRNKSNCLHQIDTYDEELPEGANSDTFENLYKLLRDKCFADFPTVKNIYDVSICPMCEGVFSTKVTLEHIIPKGTGGKYQFAILPLNLVKCCGECNTSKHQKHSTSPENSEINPYFEKFDVNKYIRFEFSNSSIIEGWGPIVKVKNSSSETTEDKRIKNFIEIYNLISTYQHRVNIEYSRMISTISKQLVFPISRQTMKSYIEYLSKQYSAKFVTEEGWIDQNYFGQQICETLIDLFNADARTIDQFCEVIKKKQLNIDSLVFEKDDFKEKLKDTNHQNLEDYLNWLEELVKSYKDDFFRYYDYLKENQVTYNLPRPNSKIISDNVYRVISAMFEYYMNDKQQDFTDFKTKCSSLL